jgi:hypothetical protein
MELEGKDLAYWERNQLVCLLTKIFPSHLAKHTHEDWEDDWRNIVCIHTPHGQATWHIHDSELKYFNHLEVKDDHWDGHSLDKKYERLRELGAKIDSG